MGGVREEGEDELRLGGWVGRGGVGGYGIPIGEYHGRDVDEEPVEETERAWRAAGTFARRKGVGRGVGDLSWACSERCR